MFSEIAGLVGSIAGGSQTDAAPLTQNSSTGGNHVGAFSVGEYENTGTKIAKYALYGVGAVVLLKIIRG
jgi:hypothetical protein